MCVKVLGDGAGDALPILGGRDPLLVLPFDNGRWFVLMLGTDLLSSTKSPEDADLPDEAPILLAFLPSALAELEGDRSLAVQGFFLASKLGTIDEVEVPMAPPPSLIVRNDSLCVGSGEGSSFLFLTFPSSMLGSPVFSRVPMDFHTSPDASRHTPSFANVSSGGGGGLIGGLCLMS